MISKLESKTQGMDLWSARKIIENYSANGKTITPEVREDYHFFSGLGMKSYSLMIVLAGEEIAKEIARLDNLNI
jgi:hypothetical protein